MSITGLSAWLLGEGASLASVDALLDGYRGACAEASIPVDRLFFGSVVSNPQAAGVAAIVEDGSAREVSVGHADFERLNRVLCSPIKSILQGCGELRARLACGEDHDMDDLRGLAAEGYTDYIGLTAERRGRPSGGLLVATRATEGFSEAQIELLRQAMPAFSAVVYNLVQRRVQRTLLKAYLGSDAGTRVHRGEAQRGRWRAQRGAILLADIRGFTQFTAEHPVATVLEVINRVFEQLVEDIQANGGQVLKFMGDGLLAMFGDEDPSVACGGAARAARASQRAFRAARRDHPERITPLVGIGLHYGEAAYGNIGAPGRLDFTVIGAAVNLTARIEALCGPHQRPILMSSELAETVGETSEPIGEFTLKGVPEPRRVFALEP